MAFRTHILPLFLLIMVISTSGFSNVLPPKTYIYDNTTSLTTATVDGHYLRLSYTIDGKYDVWDITEQIGYSGVPIRHMVKEVVFKNKTEVWIISRLGRRLDGAVLLDLTAKKIEKGYYGKYFSLSPDKQHIAYSYPTGNSVFEKIVLFIDDTMVYPIREHGFILHTTSGPQKDNGTEKDDGTKYGYFLSPEAPKQQIRSQIAWEDGNEIKLILEVESKSENERLYKECSIIKLFEGSKDEVLIQTEPLLSTDLKNALKRIELKRQSYSDK